MFRGEFVRLALVASKADWEDERITFHDYFVGKRRNEMPNLKVPVLVVNGE